MCRTIGALGSHVAGDARLAVAANRRAVPTDHDVRFEFPGDVRHWLLRDVDAAPPEPRIAPLASPRFVVLFLRLPSRRLHSRKNP